MRMSGFHPYCTCTHTRTPCPSLGLYTLHAPGPVPTTACALQVRNFCPPGKSKTQQLGRKHKARRVKDNRATLPQLGRGKLPDGRGKVHDIAGRLGHQRRSATSMEDDAEVEERPKPVRGVRKAEAEPAQTGTYIGQTLKFPTIS